MAVLNYGRIETLRRWRASGLLCSEVVIDLTATPAGGITNYIGAELFGLDQIKECTNFTSSTNRLVIATPSYDGSKLLLYDMKVVADGDRETPTDVSLKIQGVVKGTGHG